LLAELHGKAGKVVAGLRLIDEALAIADTNSESWCNVELHRERGELLLLEAGERAEDQADRQFQTAVETAIVQGAKLPELRASVSLARLKAARGGRQQAYDILAPICGWFSEGLETRDLVEARTLLAELQ
jgi:predicted ATPase